MWGLPPRSGSPRLVSQDIEIKEDGSVWRHYVEVGAPP